MHPRGRLRQFARSAIRRLVIACALLGQLAATVGFPAPARPLSKESIAGGSSPCAGLACGCDSAARAEQRCCCSAPAARPSCGHCAAEEEQSCRGDSQASAGEDSIRWVLGLQARQCRGLDTFWLALGAALPPCLPVSWSCDRRPGDWLPHFSEYAAAPVSAPPTPPPRA